MEKYSEEWLVEELKENLYKQHHVIADTRLLITMAPEGESVEKLEKLIANFEEDISDTMNTLKNHFRKQNND